MGAREGCQQPGVATGHAVPEQLVARHPSSPARPGLEEAVAVLSTLPQRWQRSVLIPQCYAAGFGNLRKTSSD